MADEFIERVS